MKNEKILNNYYNIGGFNKPEKIGYMMKMIRDLKPITEIEWKIWYLKNVHDEYFLHNLAVEMQKTIPSDKNVTVQECYDYICDVMFRRTFQGYNKENLALALLREKVSASVSEAPAEWDTTYFIDFFVNNSNGVPIGIQLKPETFFLGNYQNVVDIEGKMKAFCNCYGTRAFVLVYRNNNGNRLEIVNPEEIEKIKKLL